MKWAGWVLVIVCVAVFALRLYIAFSSPGLSTDEAYFNLRQIEHIRKTGLPLYDDPLSWGGRHYFFTPVFHYFVAAGSLVMPLSTAVKVIPNFFAVLLMPILFLIVSRLSKKVFVALFSAVFSAFVPVWFGQTINTLSPLTLAVPLLFFVIYAWLRVQEQHWRYAYLCALIIFAFTHPLSIFFVLGLILYIVLIVVERLKIERPELEITLFSVFFVLWSQFLLYKNFILVHGLAVIWQNIPPALLSTRFSEVTIISVIYQIGILPVLYGIFVVYRYLFRRKHKLTYFLISFAFAAALLLWFRLIPISLGMILLGMLLLVLFSKWVDFFLDYILTTRVHGIKPLFVLALIAAFAITGILPSWNAALAVQRDALPIAGLRAYAWIRTQTPVAGAVVASVDDGHRIAELTGRKNVIDNHFLMQKDAKQRLRDVNRIFSTTIGVEAIELMERYDAGIILLSPEISRKMRIENLAYAEQSRCFDKTFSEGGYSVFVKLPFCKVEVVS